MKTKETSLNDPIEMTLPMRRMNNIGTTMGRCDVSTVVPLVIGWPIAQNISGTMETTTILLHLHADEQARGYIPTQYQATHGQSERSLKDQGNAGTKNIGTTTILLWRTISGNQTTTIPREGAAQH